ncbi:hypothetical protein [Salipiger mucosus]|uniref:Secreted protein n=1 Tax=Salipiger mucosus DSM 16094 TaxID=1123237 RepID=S9QJ31_9RHOB|nr:hypothetical protein [Salipiger mucosus]EPX79563.1 hypothetical protein Salmuc_05503 [Salipiger mucosus DSM 16094]
MTLKDILASAALAGMLATSAAQAQDANGDTDVEDDDPYALAYGSAGNTQGLAIAGGALLAAAALAAGSDSSSSSSSTAAE